MKIMSTIAVATTLVLGLASAAQAQSFAPQIPNPANPTPANPVATDGSALPSYGHGLITGRSASVGGTVIDIPGAAIAAGR